jgi:hypothetical protein
MRRLFKVVKARGHVMPFAGARRGVLSPREGPALPHCRPPDLSEALML